MAVDRDGADEQPSAAQAGHDGVVVVPMRRRHLRAVLDIEERTNHRPWSLALFQGELRMPTSRRYVVALDGQWYVGESAADCHFRDNLMSYDLETWRAQTGFDQSSVCAPIPGFGAFATGIPTAAWDATFMAAFVPPDAWSACDAPIGAFDCDGQRSGPPLEPQSGLDGLGWPGPLVVQQRYALGQ